MRKLVVGFAFGGLGADRCESGYIAGNHASAAVSRNVGYVDDGRRRIVQRTRQGKIGANQQRVAATPATFVRPVGPVSVQGGHALRRFLGIDRLQSPTTTRERHDPGRPRGPGEEGS